jgi:F-type H+-transporting ATPase subunit delta
LTTLANNGKLFLLKNIFIEFNSLLDEKNGVIEVTITTIDSIEKNLQNKIQSSLEKTLNCKVKLREIIDKSIIGGIILKVNSIMIDNSIKNKLQDYNFNERLN